jgi:YHS domain-containing protein
MKIRVVIGLLLVLVLSVSQVSGQCSSSETACCSASPQKTAALTASEQKATACSATVNAKLASVDAKQAACCSGTVNAKLASVDAKQAACCSGTVNAKLASVDAKQATCSGVANAKLASATPGCPLQAAGIELSTKQQARVQAILAQARRDVLAALTSDQKVKFAKVPLMALVFGQQASFAATVATSTEPCCATKTVAQTATCPADCQKPCCAAKTTTVAQTTCPIMGSPIKKSVFTVYEGKKVYFCCPGCDKAFNKNPDKYAKNLPQFKQ